VTPCTICLAYESTDVVVVGGLVLRLCGDVHCLDRLRERLKELKRTRQAQAEARPRRMRPQEAE
jgi:hypothetical protein